VKSKSPLSAAAAFAVLAVATTHAATTIATDNFDYASGGYPAATPWGSSGSASIGQWSLVASTTQFGRVAIDNNSLGYSGVPDPLPNSLGYAQFSNGNASVFAGAITDTTAHAFTAGDQVAINFFSAGRFGTAGALTMTVSLVGTETINYGQFTPDGATWGEQTTGYLTIPTTGTYSVRFANVQQSGDRTTFIDSISYSVIPEPSSAACLLGLGAMSLLRRRR
jgi:hypothetical protein